MKTLTNIASIAVFGLIGQNMLAQDRVKEIRQQYADVQQQIKMIKEEPHALNVVEIKSRCTEGGVGIVEETYTFYSQLVYNNAIDGYQDFYAPLFVRTKREYKEAIIGTTNGEYLYDTQSGNLVFCFRKSDGYEDNENMYEEQRFYYNADGSLNTSNAVVKQKPDNKQVTTFVANEEVAIEQSRHLLSIFNNIKNPQLVYTNDKQVTESADLNFFELKGPVKRVLINESEELLFDKQGFLIRRDGVDPFRATGPTREMIDPEGEQQIVDRIWMQRNRQGLICAENYYEMATDYTVDLEGRRLSNQSFCEGYASATTYQYDNQKRIIKYTEQEINFEEDENGNHKIVGEPEVITITYTATDSHGNWTERRHSNGGIFKRTIEYY